MQLMLIFFVPLLPKRHCAFSSINTGKFEKKKPENISRYFLTAHGTNFPFFSTRNYSSKMYKNSKCFSTSRKCRKMQPSKYWWMVLNIFPPILLVFAHFCSQCINLHIYQTCAVFSSLPRGNREVSNVFGADFLA